VPRKILLADDSVTAQNMGKKILSDAGYEVITVSNGSAALKKANELLPDIVVLDVYMPGYSGLEVCKLLKENRVTAEIPILLTVGKLEPFKSEEALKARANAFIVKPFEATELLAVVRKIEDASFDANSKGERKPSKTPKTSTLARVFAVSATVDEPDPDAGIEEKGWKNRLAMPSKARIAVAPEPEEDAAMMGTGFRDLTPAATDESTLRRESAFTADAVEARVPEIDSTKQGTGVPLDISPAEIAAIQAAVEVLSGEGDRAPVLHMAAVDGMPRQLAPEPEEAPEELAAPRIFEAAPVETPAAVAPHWIAEAAELTPADAAVRLEREMAEALGIPTAAGTFNTHSLASFAESVVSEPVDDEPIVSEVASGEVAAADAVASEVTAEVPVIAFAASATGDGNSSHAALGAMPAAGAQAVAEATAGFQDLNPVASAAGAGAAPDVAADRIPSTAPRDPAAPEDEIDSRTKSQMDAAWSNWREIRNTIVTPSLTEQLAEIATAKEDLAPTANPDASAHDSASIASIVDSVLAEMRPKLVEEIARKLAAKRE